MPRFAANLTMLFNEVPFMDRFKMAATHGFKAVEFLFPYAFDANEIKQKLSEHNLELPLFNMPPGDWDKGERGMAAIPARREEFRENVELALNYADILSPPRLHAMAGLINSNDDRIAMEECYISNLQFAADECAKKGITLLIEPLNSRDIPGYFLQYTDQAREIIEKVNRPNIALQLDIYHLQIMEGDLEKNCRTLADITGHIQIAGVPDRHEPNTGEINYSHIFNVIDDTGYDGWLGCEYKPATTTIDGLGWIKELNS